MRPAEDRRGPLRRPDPLRDGPLTRLLARPLARGFAPLARRMVYPSGATRVPVAGTDLHLDVPGARLHGWVVNPGRDRAVLYFGGNGEPVQLLRGELARHLPDHTAYLLAYRGYGASEGRPSQTALVGDGVALADDVGARHPAGLDVIGRSLGSGVAVQVAARREVRRLVLVTPFDSLVAVAADLVPRVPVRLLLGDRFDSAALAPGLDAPVLVLRAGRDTVVRPPRTDALLAALPASTGVLDVADADHRSLSADPAYWPTIRTFLGYDDRTGEHGEQD